VKKGGHEGLDYEGTVFGEMGGDVLEAADLLVLGRHSGRWM
jgi:hypothetical protein